MIKAYILINTKARDLPQVIEKVKQIEGLNVISAVTGVHDLIAVVRVEKIEDLFEITNKMSDIDGIEKTETAVVTKEL